MQHRKLGKIETSWIGSHRTNILNCLLDTTRLTVLPFLSNVNQYDGNFILSFCSIIELPHKKFQFNHINDHKVLDYKNKL